MNTFKKLGYAIGLMLIGFTANAQESEIHFVTGLSWKQVQAKAKTEHKYIFMDCFATWCGPCKWMAANIFTQKEVADYYNANFINVAVQMDQTSKDGLEIKSWYADAAAITKAYHIDAYPNYLFFSPNGKLVHRLIGTVKGGNEFINTAKDAQDPSQQYYTVIEDYKKHLGDSLYLKQATDLALKQEDQVHGILIGNEYFNTLKQPLTKENIQFFTNRNFMMTGTKNRIFLLFLNNTTKIDSTMHRKGYTAHYLANVIFHDQVIPLYDRENARLDWRDITADLRGKYPGLGEELIPEEKVFFEQLINIDIYKASFKDKKPISDFNWLVFTKSLSKKYQGYDFNPNLLKWQCSYYKAGEQWQRCARAMYELLHGYSDQISYLELNNDVWDFIFLHGKDPKVLQEATVWIRKNIDNHPDYNSPAALDTYANLLYKAGKTREAIDWEQKAISAAGDKVEYTANLDKMKKREPTWLDDTPVKISKDN